MKIVVKTSCNNQDWSKDELVTHSKMPLVDFYKSIGFEYPKFYKMDILSQKGLLLVEYLLQGQKINPEMTGIFLWNEKSSLEADLKHQENIKTGLDNPANFVYTLPNICIGEIAIRHKITGETGFFISPSFSEQEMLATLALYATPELKYIIAGCLNEKESVIYLLEL